MESRYSNSCIKNKGDVQNCASYRGIKQMNHTMTLWERVRERRLRKETKMTENQFGFRLTIEAIHLPRQLIGKYQKTKQQSHMVFFDLEKAYDRTPRETMRRILEKNDVKSSIY